MADDQRIAAAREKIAAGVEELRRLKYRPGEDAPEAYSCTFCARANTEVERIIAGAGVSICDKCITEFSQWIAE